MTLRPDQLDPFQRAMLSAFPSTNDLARMLRLQMGVHLNHHVTASSLQDQVFELIGWAESQGRAQELAKSALQQVPGNLELQEAVEAVLDPGRRFGLVIHNWQRDTYPIRVDREFDWCNLFDLSDRRLPEPHWWQNELMPTLSEVRTEFQSAPEPRTIRLRGRCCNSVGIAVGNTFPYTGGWRLEVQQQDSRWRTDDASGGPKTVFRESIWNSQGTEAALVICVTGNAWGRVENYLKVTNLPIRVVLTAEPEGGPDQEAMAGGGHAKQFAKEVKSRLAAMLDQFPAQRTHVFCFAPLGLAAFLGYFLARVGDLQCHEPTGRSYQPSCTLHT